MCLTPVSPSIKLHVVIAIWGVNPPRYSSRTWMPPLPPLPHACWFAASQCITGKLLCSRARACACAFVCVCVCVVTLFQAWWGLPFKPGSTGVLVCGMEPIQIDSAIAGVNVGRWPVTDQMNILGDWVQSDSGIRHDRQLAKNAMWASFGANSGCRRATVVPLFRRVRMLYRTVTSALVWKVSAWPFQQSVAQEIDTVQCQMLCKVIPCVPRALSLLTVLIVGEREPPEVWLLKLAYGASYWLPARWHGTSTWPVVPRITISARLAETP